MTLAQLQKAVNETAQREKHPEKIDVVITTELPFATCGQRPCTGVVCVGMGFDFEMGQFRIEPEEKLMCRKHDAPQKVLEYRGNYHCPKCEFMIGQGRKMGAIRFCSKCGQEVKWE